MRRLGVATLFMTLSVLAPAIAQASTVFRTINGTEYEIGFALFENVNLTKTRAQPWAGEDNDSAFMQALLASFVNDPLDADDGNLADIIPVFINQTARGDLVRGSAAWGDQENIDNGDRLIVTAYNDEGPANFGAAGTTRANPSSTDPGISSAVWWDSDPDLAFDTSSSSGFDYENLRVAVIGPAVVPLPAGAPLLLSALTALYTINRRRLQSSRR